MIAASAVAVSIGVFVDRFAPSRSLEQAVARLGEAILDAGLKPVEGRLTTIPRAAGRWQGAHKGTLADVQQAANSVLRLSTGNATALSFQGRALALLAEGQVENALQVLETAALRTPEDAGVLSDLAAVYLHRGWHQKDAHDLALALTTADRALRVDPSRPEALFNRAFALESLSLLHKAEAAWLEYLQSNPGSGWADEAEDHHTALGQIGAANPWPRDRQRLLEAVARGDHEGANKIVKRFPQEVRQWIEEDLLGLWAERVQAGDTTRAAETLTTTRGVAESLAASTGDWMPIDAIRAIDEASEPARTSLIEGHLAYRQAQKLYKERRSEAGAWFARARRNFLRAESPMAAWALLYRAIGTYEHFDFTAALHILLSLQEREKSGRYPALLGRTLWMLGLVHLADGDPELSVEAYQRALEVFEKLGAREDALGVLIGLSESYRYMGSPVDNWSNLFAGLSLARNVENPRRRHSILVEAAEACLAWGPREAASYFRDEVVRVAMAEEPVALSHALLQRSDTRRLLGDIDGARRGLIAARHHLEQISNSDLHRRVEADLLAAEGEVALDTDDPEKAYASLTRSLSFHGAKGNHFPLGRIYLARARAAIAQGKLAQAEADLRSGITEYEEQRRRVPEEQLQISFFDQSRVLFDEMIRLQAAAPNREEEAFDFAERERARALLDRLGSLFGRAKRESLLANASTSMSAQEIRAALPPGVSVVEYALLPDRLLIWVLRAQHLDFIQTEVTSASVAEQVALLQLALPTSSSSVAPAPGVALYELLIRPVEQRIPRGDTLVFVPDRSLHEVPFAALFDRQRGRYLVQDWPVLISPSATTFVLARRRDQDLMPLHTGTLLAIGNPSFRRDLNHELSDLPQAELEASAIAGLFHGSLLLAKQDATKARFLHEAGQREIVHFAGHAVVNKEFPLLSHLVLAPQRAGDNGLLFAHELYSQRLERTRLVILSACSTASGPVSGEGLISLSRAFLGAGVPAVVATAWRVDDRLSARFFGLFYQALRESRDDAEALRRAQLSMLADPDPQARSPRAWAGFLLFGSPGSFTHHVAEP